MGGHRLSVVIAWRKQERSAPGELRNRRVCPNDTVLHLSAVHTVQGVVPGHVQSVPGPGPHSASAAGMDTDDEILLDGHPEYADALYDAWEQER